jgi:hypothetical protein
MGAEPLGDYEQAICREFPMRTITLAVAIGFVVLTGKAECADDAAKRLPKDGSWVKYHWILTRDNSPKELTGSLTFKIVGTELIDQKKCRWFEGTFIYKEDGTKQRPVIMKMLVNEKVVKAVFGGNAGELAPQDR